MKKNHKSFIRLIVVGSFSVGSVGIFSDTAFLGIYLPSSSPSLISSSISVTRRFGFCVVGVVVVVCIMNINCFDSTFYLFNEVVSNFLFELPLTLPLQFLGWIFLSLQKTKTQQNNIPSPT